MTARIAGGDPYFDAHQDGLHILDRAGQFALNLLFSLSLSLFHELIPPRITISLPQ